MSLIKDAKCTSAAGHSSACVEACDVKKQIFLIRSKLELLCLIPKSSVGTVNLKMLNPFISVIILGFNYIVDIK